jgi:propane monooxygenase small subunit
MTTTERPERSVPKPVFTDAEAGAREFPDSSASARRYNYFAPAKRKQTHYEDVTVDVQPDPRHYLTQGWIYGFANGETGYPLPTDGTSSATPTRSGNRPSTGTTPTSYGS